MPVVPAPSGVMDPQPLKIVLVASEAVPFAKTGGLADVAGALPPELARLGHSVTLVIPRYGSIDGTMAGFKDWMRLAVPTASGTIGATIEQGRLADSGVQILAVRHDPYFARMGLYQESGVDYPDNLERFAFFCRAVVELLPALRKVSGWTPDLLHAHDWQTALSVVYLKTLYARSLLMKRIGTLFTVHNMGYQGLFPAAGYPKAGLGAELFTTKTLEFHGSLNLLKGALVFADFVNTVSPTYSREIQTPEFGFGLDGVVRERRDRMVGIVNGIDTEVWDPATDPHLASRYSVSNLTGKRMCKTELQRELRLPVRDVPLLAVVSRLTHQKGLDLVAEVLPELMELELQIVLLGTGDPSYEALFRSLQSRYPDKIGLRIGFDDALAHRIEAGGDMFLMPSRYEPCGLSQQYSLRYGTVPIVRRTGGLADTVAPYTPRAVREGRATGFLFSQATAESLLSVVLLALRVYADRAEWNSLIQAGMRTDVSWARPARSYVELYRTALDSRA
ncbi:MAG: glycogen synthase GlgA [Candidatus Methylomirabilaceae bacterium]